MTTVRCRQDPLAFGSRLRSHLALATQSIGVLAKQATLVRHDTERAIVPAGLRDGDDVIVVLHGLFATAGVMRPLRAGLQERTGMPTATLSYGPGPSVSALSSRLRGLCDELPRGARIHLVGHSLGGVVCRYYAQEEGDPRVVQTVSLASPFAGLPRARLLGFGSVRDLDETSPLLRRLTLGSLGSSLPHLSVIAGEDGFVRTPVAHALPGGEVRVVPGLGHNALLYDDAVVELVASRLRVRRAP